MTYPRRRFAAARIGTEMIDSGVRVLIITSLDADSGKAVLDRARAARIPTIDYDRLTLNGGADYHVSFNNVEVGELQGKGLRTCLSRKGVRNPVVAQLNGSHTDNNATLFKQGYDSVLMPMYDNATYTKGPEQWVPDWDAAEAGRIFQQMIEQQPRISGVVAANDGIGNAVIEVLRRAGRAGDVPVTGQDATLDGLRNLLTGEQCVTVYKRIKPEAQTAADLAVQLFRGAQPVARAQIKDPESGAYIPFFPLKPQAVDVTRVKDVVADGFVTTDQLCTAKYDDLCKRYGVGGP